MASSLSSTVTDPDGWDTTPGIVIFGREQSGNNDQALRVEPLVTNDLGLWRRLALDLCRLGSSGCR